jgi:putative DNA primase/helicase
MSEVESTVSQESLFGAGSEDFRQAEWLAVQLDGQWKYDHLMKRWHHWNGIRWAPDNTNAITSAVSRKAADRLLDRTRPLPAAYEKALPRLFNVASINRALDALASMDDYKTDGETWDQVPYLLGCENGILDLRTNTLVEKPSPDSMVTRTTGHKFHPVSGPDDFARVAPRFMTFMHEITSQDPTMVDFLLSWYGSSMFGFSPEQRFLLLTGIGRNGKGALKHAIMKALGYDYAAQPDANIYMRTKFGAARSDGARADLIDLRGRRITFFSEPEGNRFAEETLKAHTGGDLITARTLFSSKMSSWSPTHSITFLVNNAPEVEDLGPSMGSRVMVADFRERYDGANEDKRLYFTLEKEAEGILSILAWYAKRWYDSWSSTGVGLELPQRVVEQSRKFMEKGDIVAQFLHDRVVADEGERAPAGRLYEAFIDWFNKNHADGEPISQVRFAQAMERKGFRKNRTVAGAGYIGIRLLRTDELAYLEEDDGE